MDPSITPTAVRSAPRRSVPKRKASEERTGAEEESSGSEEDVFSRDTSISSIADAGNPTKHQRVEKTKPSKFISSTYRRLLD